MRHYQYNDWRWIEGVVPRILKRDNYTCQKCGAIHRLNVHHRWYDWKLKEWEYPDEALVTLCSSCNRAAKNIRQDLGRWADNRTAYDAMIALRDLLDNGGAIQARNILFNLLSNFQNARLEPLIANGKQSVFQL